jgi:glycosyltransferase involved in cell wall biosynthesis
MLKSSLIISTYNDPKKLNLVLEHLNLGLQLPHEIIIADDGSSKETKDVLNYWGSKLNLRHLWHEDLGFRKCKILNECLKEAQSDYIIFLDGDCLPHKFFIKDHLTLAKEGFFVQGRRCFIPEIHVPQIVAKKTTIKQLFFQLKLKGYFKSVRLPMPIAFVNKKQRGLIGCNWSAWHEDLIKTNGFDEEFEGWGYEDSEICTRLYNNGISRRFIYGRAIVYHMNHPIKDRSNSSAAFRRLQTTIKTKKRSCSKGLSKL